MQKMKWITGFAIIFFNLVSYAATTPAIYTEDKPGIIVSQNQPQFIIKLKANPTTGYSWFLRDYDDRVIQPIKQQYAAPKTDMVGAPGYDVWTFKVKANAFTVPQQTVVRFVYSRPWEGLAQEQAKEMVFRISTHQ